MKKETFRLLDAINREGIDNGMWGFCQDIKDTTDCLIATYTTWDFIALDVCFAPLHQSRRKGANLKCSLLLRKGFIFVLSANLWKKGIMTISNPRNNALNGG